MERAPKKPTSARPSRWWDRSPADEMSKVDRERMVARLRAELRKLGTHGFLTRLQAVIWIKEGRPYSDVAKILRMLLNRAVPKRTIAGWVRTAEKKGLEALHDRRSRAALAAYQAGAQIRKLRARGVSTSGIARRLNVGEIWVRRYLAMRNGQPLP